MTAVEHSILATLCLFISYCVGRYTGRNEGMRHAVEWLMEKGCLKDDKVELLKEDDDE